MRVTITHPFCWPYVRRGTERFIAELARVVARYGHEVTTVSTKPGRSAVETTDDSGTRVLNRHVWRPWMSRFRLMNTDPFVMTSFFSHLKLRSDVVHCLYHTDAISACWSRPFARHKVVLQVQGAPYPPTFRRIPPERASFAKLLKKCDRVVTISQFCRNLMIEHYGVDPQVINLPVHTDHFTPLAEPKTGPPKILSAASFKDRRKGARTLVKAFPLVKERVPDAILQLSGEMTTELFAELQEMVPEHVRPDMQILGVGKLEDLPRLYREATVTCLPSMWEAFGMVVLESWASGTPVVATRHGAFPELLSDNPHLGVLFDPETDGFETTNHVGLADALVQGIELAKRPNIKEECRTKSMECSWHALGPKFESVYHEVTGL